jgi:hypothetical protein
VPTLLRFRLELITETKLLLQNGPAQGWFLKLVQHIDPEWAATLHSDHPSSRRAYTVSPLYPITAPLPPLADENDPLPHFSLNSAPTVERTRRLPFHSQVGDRGSENTFPVSVRGQVGFRVALADDDLAAAFCRALPDHLTHHGLPKLGSAPCRLLSSFALVDTALQDADHDTLFSSWETLAQAPPYTRLRLVFATPTTFKSQGDLLPRAEPERFWASWQSTWRDLAPFLPENFALLEHELPRISAYQLETRSLSVKGGLFIGFVGWMELAWRPSAPPELRRAAAAVASVSDFFGTGAKTALGMGQTRCLFRED